MVGLKLEPVKYKRFERTPIGCFSAEMTANGWANTKFDHDLQSHLLSNEVSEFVTIVYTLFKECQDWATLGKFAKKYGTEVEGDDFSTALAFNCLCDTLDYVVYINGTQLRVFPYRKFNHH